MKTKKLMGVAERRFDEHGRFAIKCPGCGKEIEFVIDDLAILHEIRSKLASGEIRTEAEIASLIRDRFDKK